MAPLYVVGDVQALRAGTLPTFSINGTNAAKNATATFSMAGSYIFRVRVADGTEAIISDVTVTVVNT